MVNSTIYLWVVSLCFFDDFNGEHLHGFHGFHGFRCASVDSGERAMAPESTCAQRAPCACHLWRFHLAKRAKGSDTDVQTVEKRCKNDKLGKKSETLMKIEENWNEHLLNFRTWHKLHRLPVNHPEIHSHFKVVLSYGFAVKRTFLRQKKTAALHAAWSFGTVGRSSLESHHTTVSKKAVTVMWVKQS